MHEVLDFVGVIPMAGLGSRLGTLPFSKELYPVAIPERLWEKESFKPAVISDVLVAQMKYAGIRNIHMVIREGKWDIPGHFRGGGDRGLNIAFHVADNESGVPFSIRQAYPFIKGRHVVMGFPDIYMSPGTVPTRLMDALSKEREAQVVLALFHVEDPENWDVAGMKPNGLVWDIAVKEPSEKVGSMAWVAAAWKPGFSDFLNACVADRTGGMVDGREGELQLSHVFLEYIKNGNKIRGMKVPGGTCADLGTPEGLRRFSHLLRTNKP